MDAPVFEDPHCTACGRPCGVEEVDGGYGACEYWGRPVVDVRLCDVSRCCGCEVREGPYPGEGVDDEE